MSTFDLHLHSNVSDGRLSPAELVRLAHQQGVRVMALTDHDTTDGVAEATAAGTQLGVRVIPGIELSTDAPGASIHVLGVFLRYEDPAFQEMVTRFREARVGRAEKMVDALRRLGYPVALDRVFEIAGEGSVGRPHVAQALLEAGHVASIREAFDRFLATGGPAYFEGFPLEPRQAVELIHAAGGLASWAHPYELDGKDWREYFPLLRDGGVDALEAYYGKSYPPGAREALLTACEQAGLLATAGSDFHGFQGMEQLPGQVDAPADLLEQLEERVEQVRRSTAG